MPDVTVDPGSGRDVAAPDAHDENPVEVSEVVVLDAKGKPIEIDRVAVDPAGNTVAVDKKTVFDGAEPVADKEIVAGDDVDDDVEGPDLSVTRPRI